MKHIRLIMLFLLTSTLTTLADEKNEVLRLITKQIKIENNEDGRSMGGLVETEHSCPKNNEGFDYLSEYKSKQIDKQSKAILVDTLMCGGGNGGREYLLISTSGQIELKTKPRLGSGFFITNKLGVNKRNVVLNGVHWSSNDAHCCPSKRGTIRYDIITNHYDVKLSPLN